MRREESRPRDSSSTRRTELSHLQTMYHYTHNTNISTSKPLIMPFGACEMSSTQFIFSTCIYLSIRRLVLIKIHYFVPRAPL